MKIADLRQSEAVLETLSMQKRLSQTLKVDILKNQNLEKSMLYKQIWRHRSDYYLKNAPHLLKLKERALEHKLDQRGIIFSLSCKNKVLASLRFVASPFEIESYDNHDFQFDDYKNYYEIGRLVTNPAMDSKTLVLVVQYLLCVSGLEIFSKESCQGLIGICKPESLKLFSRFGLQKVGTSFHPGRKITYDIITGSTESILSNTQSAQTSTEKLTQRLNYTLGL